MKMPNLSHISFENPWILFGLLLVPLLTYLWFFKKNKIHTPISWSNLKEEINYKSWRSRMASLLPILQLLFLTASIVALARPQIRLTEEKIKAQGIDIFLAMDLSSSMLSKDFDPDRLSVSKAVAIDFVSKRPYDRIGLVSFAGEAYTQSPLTTDHDLIQELLSTLRCGYLNDGTAIGMGLATAVNRLKESEAETKVIILLTDGVNNQGYIAPKTAAEIAKELGVRVYTIGVGTEGLAMSPVGRTRNGQYSFARARVQIDDKLLTEIANMTGGAYYRATTAEALEQIYNKIDELEKTDIEITVIQRVKEYYFPLLGIAFACLLLFFIIKYGWLRLWPD